MRNSTSPTSIGRRSDMSPARSGVWSGWRTSEVVSLAGGVLWTFLWTFYFRPGGTMQMIEAILSLSILVIVPLLLGLIAESDLAGEPEPLLDRCLAYYPPSAIAAVLGLLTPIGLASGALIVPWLAFTASLGVCGLRRLLRPMPWRPESLCVTASLAYLPVGVVWLCLARFGVDPMGFGEPLVVLTAVHFHYAGFALPILTTFVAHHDDRHRTTSYRAVRLLCWGAVSGVPLTAAGISVSPILEIFAVAIVAATVVGLAVLTWVAVLPKVGIRSARFLLSLAAISATFSIVMAVTYAIGELVETTLVPIPLMVATHGWVNAIGFVLSGALGWAFLAHARPANVPCKGAE